jgi:hypothetical protein
VPFAIKISPAHDSVITKNHYINFLYCIASKTRAAIKRFFALKRLKTAVFRPENTRVNLFAVPPGGIA